MQGNEVLLSLVKEKLGLKALGFIKKLTETFVQGKKARSPKVRPSASPSSSVGEAEAPTSRQGQVR